MRFTRQSYDTTLDDLHARASVASYGCGRWIYTTRFVFIVMVSHAISVSTAIIVRRIGPSNSPRTIAFSVEILATTICDDGNFIRDRHE